MTRSRRKRGVNAATSEGSGEGTPKALQPRACERPNRLREVLRPDRLVYVVCNRGGMARQRRFPFLRPGRWAGEGAWILLASSNPVGRGPFRTWCRARHLVQAGATLGG